MRSGGDRAQPADVDPRACFVQTAGMKALSSLIINNVFVQPARRWTDRADRTLVLACRR